MQRNRSTWAYFLSLILGVALTVALLPACGGGGGEDSCNSPENQTPENQELCLAEESDEEEFDMEVEAVQEARRTEGRDGEEAVREIATCEAIGCSEL